MLTHLHDTNDAEQASLNISYSHQRSQNFTFPATQITELAGPNALNFFKYAAYQDI